MLVKIEMIKIDGLSNVEVADKFFVFAQTLYSKKEPIKKYSVAVMIEHEKKETKK